MSRQISFVHTEEDAVQLFYLIGRLGGCLFTNDARFSPEIHADAFLSKMNSSFGSYAVIPGGHVRQLEAGQSVGIFDGKAMEFRNCTKGTHSSRVYEIGRLYIRPIEDMQYDRELLSLYMQLVRYIRKNYLYLRKPNLYVSHRFDETRREKHLFAATTGRIIAL